MGTRSITVVKDENGNKIVEMYKQFDGYPEGLGKELKNFINSGVMVNGLIFGDNRKRFNGINCFAAQLVEYFKEGAGGIYLHAPTTDYTDKREYAELYMAEYYYEIDADLNLRCWDTYDNIEENLEIKNEK